MKGYLRRRRKDTSSNSRRHAAVSAVGTVTLLAAFAVASQPSPVVTEDVEEMTATVTAIQAADRLVSLETADGEKFVVEAGEEVRNFGQIEVGDIVEVMFYEAFAAEVSEASPGADEAIIESVRAPLGERPAGAAGTVYTAIVTIDSVDVDTNTVTFTGPEGVVREVTVYRPEMQEFIAELESGDRVQVTYSEAIAVAVTPAETSE